MDVPTVPKKKNVLINYERLSILLGFDSYEDVRTNHKNWVESCLHEQLNIRDEKWTRSLAVGSRSFIDGIKKEMGYAAKGRKRIGGEDSFQLRESTIPYETHLGVKNGDIDGGNTHFWEK